MDGRDNRVMKKIWEFDNIDIKILLCNEIGTEPSDVELIYKYENEGTNYEPEMVAVGINIVQEEGC
jgi:hypothetical protein